MVKTYQVIGVDGKDWKVDGTISIDDAGAITYTATPGNDALMAEIMDEPVTVRVSDPAKSNIKHVPYPGRETVENQRSVTRQEDPALWFAQLPVKYHGSAFYVVPWFPTKPVSERISNVESTRRTKRQGTPKRIRR